MKEYEGQLQIHTGGRWMLQAIDQGETPALATGVIKYRHVAGVYNCQSLTNPKTVTAKYRLLNSVINSVRQRLSTSTNIEYNSFATSRFSLRLHMKRYVLPTSK